MQPFSFENLPKDWNWTPIGEIADAVRGVAFPGNETSKGKFENSIACLTTSGVQDEVNWRSRRFIPKEFLSNEKQVLKNGDLLVSTANSKELVGKSCLIKNPTFPCTFGAFVTVLRPNIKVDNSLFAYWMRSKEVLRWCFQNSSNTTNISNLRTSELLALEIPLPKPDEQKRIAAILDKADRLRRQRRFAQTLSDSFLQSVFIKMFGDPVSNPINWKSRQVGDEVESMQYGPRFYNEVYSPKGVRIIRITDLDNLGNLNFDNMPTMEVSDSDIKSYSLKQGDLIFARSGATVGKTALIPENSPVCIAGAYFITMRFKKSLNPVFVRNLFASKPVQAIIEQKSRQSAQQNFSGPGLRDLPLPMPPLPLQEKFAEIVQKFERVRRQQREATRQAEHLFQTLLHRAFRGEL